MEFIEGIIVGSQVIVVIFAWIVGILLIKRAIPTKMNNVILLGVGFLFNGLGIILSSITPLEWVDIAWIKSISYLIQAIFVYLTYYNGKENRGRVLLVLNFILYILVCTLTYLFVNVFNRNQTLYYIASFFDMMQVWFSVGWFGIMSLKLHKKTKYQEISAFTYLRLKNLGYFSMAFCIGYTLWQLEYILHTESFLAFLYLETTIVGEIYAVGMYFYWIGPQWFRNYINTRKRRLKIKEIEPFEELDENAIAKQMQSQNSSSNSKYLSNQDESEDE